MSVGAQTLALLPNLHILLLSSNQLTSLHPRSLAGLGVLSSLALNQNRLRDLPPGLFANTSSLQECGFLASSYFCFKKKS
jgi:Leucine-rich repeat (LRR) protein